MRQKQLNVKDVVARIKKVLPERRPIDHHEPLLNGREAEYVTDCLLNDPVGHSYIRRFEQKLTEVVGASQALAVSSGTAALHLALMAAGVNPGDEVLVPSLTFVATANAVVHAGATPNFVDGALNINPYKLRCYLARETLATGHGRVNKRTERPVTALIVVHLLGIPADMAALEKIASEFGLILIEDAAEALGSKCGNRPCGSLGAASVLSFNCNKIVTTGGGGALLTNDEWVLAKAYQLSTTSRMPHKWLIEHDTVAWNYRMTNVTAAMGLAQLEQLPVFLKKKQELASKYFDALNGSGGLCLWFGPPGSNYWLNALLVNKPEDRDPLLEALHADGIKARAIFTPLHKLPMFEKNPRDNNMGYAEDTANRMICLPSGAGLL